MRSRSVRVLLTAVAVAAVAVPITGVATEPAPQTPEPGFYVNPEMQAKAWVHANPSDPRAAAIDAAIAQVPQGIWFGDWSGPDIRAEVSRVVTAANAAGKVPILVAYNIYGRDCGSHSGGGAKTPAEYLAWITRFAAGIAQHRAIVVLEPDALAQRVTCVPEADRDTRMRLVQHAVRVLGALPRAGTYLDAGNSGWVPAPTMADELATAGVHRIRGFAVNVSNYWTTEQAQVFADDIAGRVGGGVHAVVDTSRNGNGGTGEWCNPPGRRLGVQPQRVQQGSVELLLWVKGPGESDGDCGIGAGTRAGQFTPELAMALIGER